MHIRHRGFGRSRSRQGAITVLVAISLIAVMSFVAIAVDGGGLLERKQKAQATADAAALAAAERLFANYPRFDGIDADGSAADAAREIAAQNGFPNTGASRVFVRTSPQTYAGGPNAGQAIPRGFVEVTVRYDQPRYFSAVMGRGAIAVQARAVARGSWEASNVAIHVLDLHQSASLNGTGESALTVTGASVVVNSDASDAATSNGGTLTATEFDITGGSSTSGNGGGFYGGMNYGVPPEPDPLRHIPEPDINGISVQSSGPKNIAHGTRTLSPGTYRGGISVSGQGSVVMLPGIYYMDGGGFSFSGQGELDAQGVMIFNDPKLSSDNVSITGTGAIAMSPPIDGVYKGLSVFQKRAAANTVTVSGGGDMDITGTFYAAGAQMNVGGNGDSKVGSQYISRFLSVVGNGGLRIDYEKDDVLPRRRLNLVE